jgi:hypothetical protein
MADEFAKGLAILMTAGLGWLTLAGWYNTDSFESTAQLIQPDPAAANFYDTVAILLKDVLFWFAILGALTFWVLIPAMREARRAFQGEPEN